MDKKIQALLQKNSGIRLDIGCGENKQEGFIGMDIRDMKGVDIVHDVTKYPWPLPDDSVLLALASHLVEHINPADFGFINFMNEVWRVMKPGGEWMIVLPYAGSPGYWQDPTHVNPCNETTWHYFDPLAQQPGGGLSYLWTIYKPKPWKIKFSAYQSNGNMEIVLVKRKEQEVWYE